MQRFHTLTSFPFFLLLLLVPLSSAQAQCNPSIPPYAQQKDGTVLYGVSGDTLWLCPGSTLDLESSFGSVDSVVVFAEENSTVRVENADGNDGNKIHIQSGGQVDIGSNAANTTVHHASNVTLNDNGTGTTSNDCGSVSFDYSNAPQDDCNAQSIESEGKERKPVQVRGQGDQIFVHVPSERLRSSDELSLRIYNMLGKLMKEKAIEGSRTHLSPDLPPGIYHYAVIENGQAVEAGKLGLN